MECITNTGWIIAIEQLMEKIQLKLTDPSDNIIEYSFDDIEDCIDFIDDINENILDLNLEEFEIDKLYGLLISLENGDE